MILSSHIDIITKYNNSNYQWNYVCNTICMLYLLFPNRKTKWRLGIESETCSSTSNPSYVSLHIYNLIFPYEIWIRYGITLLHARSIDEMVLFSTRENHNLQIRLPIFSSSLFSGSAAMKGEIVVWFCGFCWREAQRLREGFRWRDGQRLSE